jgi:hypothetical protein
MGEQFTDYVGGPQIQQHGERGPEKAVGGDTGFEAYDAATKAEKGAGDRLKAQREALKAAIDMLPADDVARFMALLP